MKQSIILSLITMLMGFTGTAVLAGGAGGEITIRKRLICENNYNVFEHLSDITQSFAIWQDPESGLWDYTTEHLMFDNLQLSERGDTKIFTFIGPDSGNTIKVYQATDVIIDGEWYKAAISVLNSESPTVCVGLGLKDM